MKSSFAHLRVSSEYSIFKGLLSVVKLVEKAKSFGMPAIALTDHSNMFGLVKFFKKCEKEGIKPISGSTLNIARSSEDRPYEFLCLAKNIDGHKNLMHGLSKASRNQSGVDAPRVASRFVHTNRSPCNLASPNYVWKKDNTCDGNVGCHRGSCYQGASDFHTTNISNPDVHVAVLM